MGRLKTFCGRFWVQVGAVCLVAVLAVVARQLLLPAHGPRAQISPFFSLVHFHLGWYTFVPPLAFAAFIVPLRWALRRPPAAKLFYLALAFLAFTTTVNMAGGGPVKILPGAVWQYAFDAQKLYGHGNFLRDYHLHVVGMHWHTTTHPPGIFLYLFPLLKLFGDEWIFIALLNALVGGAGVIFVYKTADELYGPGVKDTVAALYVTTPSLILYGSTTDAVLCALGAAAVYFLALYLSRGRFIYAVLTGFTVAAGFFTAYHFGFVCVLLVTCFLIYAFYGRGKKSEHNDDAHRRKPPRSPGAARAKAVSVRRVASLTVAAGVAFALFFLIIYFVSGFDVINEFQYQRRASERYFGAGGNIVYLIKHYILGSPGYKGEHRSYLLWMPGNLVAFFFMLGPPTTILFLRNLWNELKTNNAKRAGFIISLAGAVSFVVINLSGLTLGEAERIWLFMVPWFLLGAGYYLKVKESRFFYPTLLFNLALSFAFVIFFYHVK